MNIYVVTHKAFSPPPIEGYIPIQVGKTFTGIPLGFISDDTGINIANKNDTYCELTAHYWIWKNAKPSPYIGMCHYRRYFTKNAFSVNSDFFLNEQDVKKYLENHDIILPQRVYLKETVYEKYSMTGAGFQEDLDIMKSVLLDYYPEYRQSLSNVMNGKEQYFWNMFIMPWHYFDEYSLWLFDILDKFEEIIDLSGYDKRQRRIFGYISERLLNVWVMQKQLRVHETPVVQTDLNWKNLLKSNFGLMIKKRRL